MKGISSNDWQLLLNAYPELSFSGRAYRAVINQDKESPPFHEGHNLKSGLSWSEDLDGIKQYLAEENRAAIGLFPKFPVFIMEADVLGVDLVKVAKLLKEKEIQVEDELLLEKTIIAFEVKPIRTLQYELRDLIDCDSCSS